VDTSSTGRVPASTAPHINDRILAATRASIARNGGDRAAIDRRLAALDREWDIERVTMLSATIDALLTLGLGVWRGRRWLVGGLAFLGGAMLAHVAIGQCPSLPLYRRLGVRTREEIDWERYALKALRGDFAGLDAHQARRDPEHLVDIMRA
jgi:hypothetical protein